MAEIAGKQRRVEKVGLIVLMSTPAMLAGVDNAQRFSVIVDG